MSSKNPLLRIRNAKNARQAFFRNYMILNDNLTHRHSSAIPVPTIRIWSSTVTYIPDISHNRLTIG